MVSSKIIFLSVLGVLAIVASTDAACCHCPLNGLCVDTTRVDLLLAVVVVHAISFVATVMEDAGHQAWNSKLNRMTMQHILNS